jgi:hypothetical protein
MDHQREVLRLAFAFDEDGRLPWDTIIYSCVKTRSTAPILKTYARPKFSQRWIFSRARNRKVAFQTISGGFERIGFPGLGN